MPPSPALPPLPAPAAAVTSRPRRRSLLAGALGALSALGLSTGCSAGSGESGGKSAEHSREAVKLRESAARRSRALLARYEATAAAHGALAERLTPLREAVAQHAEAFGGRKDKGGGKGGPRRGAPDEEQKALASLEEAERRTADAHTAALLEAPPGLARTLASVAAACTAHAYLLGQMDAGKKGGGDT
jgi:hypothetical protein